MLRGGEGYRDVYVLDDDVANAAIEAESLAANDALISHADDALIATHSKGRFRRVPVRAGLPRPIIASILDPELARRSTALALGGAVIAAALCRGAALRLEEVEGTVQHDDTRRIIAEVVGESGSHGVSVLVLMGLGWGVEWAYGLFDRSGIDWFGIATTRHAGGKSKGSTADLAHGRGYGRQQGRKEGSGLHVESVAQSQ